MTHKFKPKLLKSRSDETIAQFWGAHDLADYWDDLEVVKDVKFVKPKKELVSIRLEPIYCRQLKAVAKKMSLGYSSLARLLIIEKLQQGSHHRHASR